jgi:hypothetical protein
MVSVARVLSEEKAYEKSCPLKYSFSLLA